MFLILFSLSIFNLQQFFVEKIKRLIASRKLCYKKGTDLPIKEANLKMLNELMQYSTSATNDSYQTSLCLQFSPDQIATAAIYLACQFAGIKPVDGVSWREVLGDPDLESFVSICIQILDLMGERKASDTEQCTKIKAALELMKAQSERPQGGSSPKPPPPPEASQGTPPPPSSSSSDPNKRQKTEP